MQESFTKGIILKVATVYAQSLEEFISRVRDFRKKWRSTELWFRGEPPSEYPLTPSLYRPPLSRSEEELVGKMKMRPELSLGSVDMRC